MGKKARSRAQRRASTRPRQRATTASKPAESRAIVAAAAQLLDALDTYGRAVHEHREDLDVLALPDQFAICAEYALSGAALVDVQNLQLAWQIVDSNDPVLGALPHSLERTHESHRRWRGPLTPEELIRCADVDEDEDDPAHIGTYRQHLAANAEHFDAMDRARHSREELRCGRQTKSGTACGAHLVYMPIGEGSFDTNYPCRAHLTDDEHRAMTTVYTTAQQEHDCPGCEATAGRPCFAGEHHARRLKLVDGEWARKYKYKDFTVHDARLHLAAKQASPLR